MRPLTIGSLFSGIGGLELGLERGLAAAGVPTRTLWQVEQNDYARAVLARHWPHAERYTDVRDITAATVAPVDLLCGGFPCQDISLAGKGAGLAGERSGLFFEMARIVGEIRPRIVCFENVPAITTRGLDTVLGTLAALGYDARWGGLRASEVGAPHRRERWFCVAWLADSDQEQRRRSEALRDLWHNPQRSSGEGQGMADHDHQRSEARTRLPTGAGSDRSDPDRGDGCGEGMADSISHRLQGQQQARPATGAAYRTDRAGEWWKTEPGMGRDADGLPRGLDPHRWPAPPGPQHPHEPPRTRPRQPHDRDRLKALGNAVVPQCAEVIGRWIGCELVELP